MVEPTAVKSGWQVFAFGSALFAALTAIFGKLGVEEINSNFAVLIRTIIVAVITAMNIQNAITLTGDPVVGSNVVPEIFAGRNVIRGRNGSRVLTNRQ